MASWVICDDPSLLGLVPFERVVVLLIVFAVRFPRTWNGVIDEVEAYRRALTVQEIQAIFNAGSAGKCKGLVLSPRSVVFPAEPERSWPAS